MGRRSEIRNDEIGAFYADAYPRVVGELTLVAGSRSVAEDATHEAFVRLINRWSKVSSYDDPVAWLRRVAYNIVIDRHRREEREAIKGRRVPTRADAWDHYPSDDWLLEALKGLTPEHREILVLRAVHDLPVQEIATQLGLPDGTVKSRLARARVALAATLDESRNHD